MKVRRLSTLFGLAVLGGLLLALWSLPAGAQDGLPAFATNTPLAAFATNTPSPTPVAPATPDAPFERYALRLWDEPTLVSVLVSQVGLLQPGDTERALAIRLLQYELQQRFPGAPRDMGTRDRLISAMLAAPRGSVDMRPFVRSFIQDVLNQFQPALNMPGALEAGGFSLTLVPANLDGNPLTSEAVIHTRYPAPAGDTAALLYEDFTLAVIRGQGQYAVLNSTPLLPVAPLDAVQAVRLERVGDVNRDGLDELAVTVQRSGEVNFELMIFGLRGEGAAGLVQPGQMLQFGQIVDWPMGSDAITVRALRVESPAWGCLGERDVTWAWNLNFFRPIGTPGEFTFQNRLSCLLFGAEPLFELPVPEALERIQTILAFAQQDDEYSTQRATMMMAVLRVLNGEADQAIAEVRQLQAAAQPGSWLEQQAAIFLDVVTRPNSTPVQLCAALQAASQYGACDVNQVLMRIFQEQPLRRDIAIEAQLAALGISILDQLTVSAVGRLDREVVHLDLPGSSWWAFAPLAEDTYIAERIDPPPGFVSARTPTALASPQRAVDALVVNNDPAAALIALDNAIRDNPSLAVASSVRFLRALCFDLLADRSAARQAYFELWRDDPGSAWGQLAAVHLERR